MATRIKPTDFDLTHIDILGRGPSVDSYIPRKNAFVICCHYPIVECNAIGTRHFGEYGFYTVPYITIRDVETILPKPVVVKDWTVLIDSRLNSIPGPNYNTGQITYMWARAQKPKSIHLWGFDSILNNNTHSTKEVKRAVKEYNMNMVVPIEDINSVTNIPNIWSTMLNSNTVVHKG
jgi:hypothetical protein|tara:strand:- start:135 stop:665 length:531 start_codon:yes stop_codon:yes gene_type:complete